MQLATAQPEQSHKGHGALVHALAVAPDGKYLASGGFDNLIKLWEIMPDGTLKEFKTFAGHTGPVYALAFHPKAPLLISVSQDKTGRIWNLTDGKVVAELKGHADLIDAVAVSPDGLWIATGSADKGVRLWNAADGKEVKNLGAHGGTVYALAFSPDGKWLASAAADKTVKIWDVAGQKEYKVLKGHDDAVTTLTFTDNPDAVLTASLDRSLRLWSIQAVKEIKEQPKEAQKDDKNKKGEKTQQEPAVKIDPKDLGEMKRWGPTPDDPYAIVWHNGSKVFAVCGYSGQISIWSPAESQPKFSRRVPNPGYCIVFLPNGKAVVSGHDNGNLVVTPWPSK
jgi:WD40 repeat protein